jgi:LCP family protein required for cell wall assembly
MNEWPQGWFRDGAGAQDESPEAGAADQTVRISRGSGRAGAADLPGAAAGLGGASAGSSQEAPNAAWPSQPPARTPARGPRPGGGVPGGGVPRTGGGRRWLRPRRITAVIAVLVALALIFTVAMYFFLDSKLTRKNVLVDYSGRPAATAGTNWLIAGSDSRQGLSAKEERKLATGFDVGGHRSDTIMLLHIPSNGAQPVLISLPRDSYVPIPGYGDNKINAAYSFGGPRLLAKTVQNVTGLRISHYMGIGFGGFVSVVNAVGGVHMCITTPLHDVASGLNISKGCQTLDGAQALGYVRDRHDFANQDLQRIQDQRLFLRALLSKLTSAGTILNPFAAIPASIGAADTLTVDKGTSLYQLVEVAFDLRHPLSTTVPIANANYYTANAGDAVLWDTAQARQLFSALAHDQPVPKGLITGSHQGA